MSRDRRDGLALQRPSLTNVPTANTRSDGYAPAEQALAASSRRSRVAQGSTRMENSSALTSFYGYDNDVLNSAGHPQMVPTPTNPAKEAHKTEPDKNTYLVFKHGLDGADPGYDYGTDFLFQGHEGGAGGAGYITRINLDADAEHRVTLLATTDVNGNPLATIDGSTWDPWAKRLLLTTENPGAPTYAATPNFPSAVTDVSGALGRGGYEGIQDDGDGNIWIVEDIGGSSKPGTTAKRPNSFVYRYVPPTPGRPPARQAAGAPGAERSRRTDHRSPARKRSTAPTRWRCTPTARRSRPSWVTIHDTAVDGNAPFVATDLAKAAKATPFKRPENGLFQPGSQLHEVLLRRDRRHQRDQPGERRAGGWGSIIEADARAARAPSTGTLTLFYLLRRSARGLRQRRVPLAQRDHLRRRRGGHAARPAQRARLRLRLERRRRTTPTRRTSRFAGWPRVATPRRRSTPPTAASAPTRATTRSPALHVSDGDPGASGILGAEVPDLGNAQWRWFYTQQHGDNRTYEVELRRHRHDD